MSVWENLQGLKGLNVVNLFAGMEVGRLACERAGVPIDKYYSSEIDKYAIQVSKANWPDIIHLGDVTKVYGCTLPDIHLLLGGSPCFAEGTFVMTDRGYKDISKIVPGDQVLTHKGRFRKVLKTGGDFKEVWNVKGMGNPGIDTTEEHPFYCRHKTRVWDNPNRTSVRTFSDPDWTPVNRLTKDHFCGITYADEIESTGKSKDFWYLIGRYTGDGWFRKTKRKYRDNSFMYQFIICCGLSEFQELSDRFKNFGENYNFSKERTGYKFRICSQALVEFVESIGTGASNKRVHPILYNESPESIKAYLKGLFDSDGCFHIAQKERRLTTTSKELSLGVQYLVTKVYNLKTAIHFSKRPETYVIEGRTVNQKSTYVVSYKTDVRKQDSAFFENKYAWLPIRTVTNTGVKAKVYNLEVEEDNSYTANNLVVHNCQGFSFAGKQLNFNDPRSALLFEYVRILKELREFNPDVYFLLENVMMKKEYQDVISELLGVQPIMINSALVSAQNRKRLYWTNIPFLGQPEDKGIVLKDILETSGTGFDINRSERSERSEKAMCLDANYFKGADNHGQRTMITEDAHGAALRTWPRYPTEEKRVKRLEIRNDSKSNALLTGTQDDYLVALKIQIQNDTNRNFDISFHDNGNIRPHKLDSRKSGISEIGTIVHPDNKSMTCIASHVPNVLRINPSKKAAGKQPHMQDRVYDENYKSIAVTAEYASRLNVGRDMNIYRKLTPIECERLQTVPDNYSNHVSNSQRYRMLGNGWTTDVIAHLLLPLGDYSCLF